MFWLLIEVSSGKNINNQVVHSHSNNLNQHYSRIKERQLYLVVIFVRIHQQPGEFQVVTQKQGQKDKYNFHPFEKLLPHQAYFKISVELRARVNETKEVISHVLKAEVLIEKFVHADLRVWQIFL